MDSIEPASIKLYEIYLATAERVSDRRLSANSWMLSINTAIVAAFGYAVVNLSPATDIAQKIMVAMLPIAGICACFMWHALLVSYRQLNSAKFKVLQEIEQSFEHKLFSLEEKYYQSAGRFALSTIERFVPLAFILVYAVTFALMVVN